MVYFFNIHNPFLCYTDGVFPYLFFSGGYGGIKKRQLILVVIIFICLVYFSFGVVAASEILFSWQIESLSIASCSSWNGSSSILQRERHIKSGNHVVQEEKPFNEAELSKLQQVLGLTSEELEDLIDACTFTFEHAAIHSVSMTNLVHSLKLSGLTSSLAAFQELWTRSGHTLVTAFKEKSLGAPGNSQLVDVQWRVHVQVASSNERRQREPTGILQMNLLTPEKGYETAVEKALTLGFSYAELFDFYEKLEKIQEQLDSS